ncbi:LOB domain-containing protein 40 [Mercurialis annua]|uniref:LOB domain-containing protein 40 n=1 Tax=Mercurialis annua TaxID=3986 RepID=UPI00215F64BC|nr:LOB domain-containing protein 40 [Mercurialis annua]
MRMSCNGCRVLRKGCSENCSIRPCLQWIKTPESQANATVFLAKFYGRAGLMNLINAGPDHLRPAIFRSLLYEACGRIVNPIYGSVGLLWSGSWQLCQAAVESVLKGIPVTPINSEAAANGHGPPLKAYDIRHVSKDENSAASNEPIRVKTRCRVRRAMKPKASDGGIGINETKNSNSKPGTGLTRSLSHESSVSHQSELAMVDGDSKETESMISVETAEVSLLFRAEPESAAKGNEGISEDHGSSSTEMVVGLGLELTLGLEPASRASHVVPVKKRKIESSCYSDDDTCKIELGLDYH